MKNKNDKRGKSPANFYDRIAEMLNKAAIPQTITVEAEGVSPESPVFIFFKDYDAVCFSYGYTRRRMLWECKGVDFGRGRPEWGAPDHETFIIKLGNRLNDERLQ